VIFRACDDQATIAALDALCFPIDTAAEFSGASWYIGWDLETPAAFCGWRMVVHSTPVGFHYRAGVLPAYRGHGLQKQMIRLREARMREASLKRAVTYTDADCAPSINNLIAEGYRAYCPDEKTVLSGIGRLGRCGFVHWAKNL
jgi:GNAT superfamily N-acetyltransferase